MRLRQMFLKNWCGLCRIRIGESKKSKNFQVHRLERQRGEGGDKVGSAHALSCRLSHGGNNSPILPQFGSLRDAKGEGENLEEAAKLEGAQLGESDSPVVPPFGPLPHDCSGAMGSKVWNCMTCDLIFSQGTGTLSQERTSQMLRRTSIWRDGNRWERGSN